MQKWNDKIVLICSPDQGELSHEQAILEKHSNSVLFASTHKKALSLHADAENRTFDLILYDASAMPDSNTEPRNIRRHFQEIRPVPVLFIWDKNNLPDEGESSFYSTHGCLFRGSHELVFMQTILMAFELFTADQKQLVKSKQLSYNERFLKNLLDSLNEGIVVLDTDFRQIYLNKKMDEISGIPREEAIGKTAKEAFPFLEDYVLEGQKKALSGTPVLNVENKFEIPGGKSGWTKESFIPLKNKAGEIDGAITVIQDITEQKRISRELKQSKKRYQALIESSPTAIIVHDGKEILFANPAANKMLNPDRDTLLGESIRKFIHPDIIDEVKERMQKVLNKQSVSFKEQRLLKSDGSSFYARVCAVPVEFNGRNAIQVIAEDITEQKTIQSELSKLSTSFAAVTGQELFDNVCKNLCEILDMDYAMIGEHVEDQNSIHSISFFEGQKRLPNVDYNLEHTPCSEVMEGELCTYDRQVQQTFPKDEMLKNYKIEAYAGLPLYSKEGKRLGILVILKKTSLQNVQQVESLLQLYSERVSAEMERLQTERLIEEKDALISSISSNISEGIYRSTPNSGLIYVNQAFANMFGYSSPEEVLKIESSYELYANQEDRDIFIEKSRGKSQVKDFEIEFKKKDGTTFWGLMSTSIIYDEEGNPKYYDGAIRDITSRIIYEEKLQASLEEKEVMLAEIHHRVKNNLAVISGLIDLQMLNFENNQLETFLQSTQNRILSIANVHELLYHSENFADIKAQLLVDNLCEAVSKTFNSSDLNITFDKKIKDISMNANQAVPFGLLLNELINNTYKHAFKEDDKGTVTITLKKQSKKNVFIYRDNGIGIENTYTLENLPEDSLGFSLIKKLSQQLGAEKMIMEKDNGFHFKMSFPVSEETKKGSVLRKSFSSDLKNLYDE